MAIYDQLRRMGSPLNVYDDMATRGEPRIGTSDVNARRQLWRETPDIDMREMNRNTLYGTGIPTQSRLYDNMGKLGEIIAQLEYAKENVRRQPTNWASLNEYDKLRKQAADLQGSIAQDQALLKRFEGEKGTLDKAYQQDQAERRKFIPEQRIVPGDEDRFGFRETLEGGYTNVGPGSMTRAEKAEADKYRRLIDIERAKKPSITQKDILTAQNKAWETAINGAKTTDMQGNETVDIQKAQELYSVITGKKSDQVITLPPNIKTTGQAVEYLIGQGMTQEQAITWLRSMSGQQTQQPQKEQPKKEKKSDKVKNTVEMPTVIPNNTKTGSYSDFIRDLERQQAIQQRSGITGNLNRLRHGMNQIFTR